MISAHGMIRVVSYISNICSRHSARRQGEELIILAHPELPLATLFVYQPTSMDDGVWHACMRVTSTLVSSWNA